MTLTQWLAGATADILHNQRSLFCSTADLDTLSANASTFDYFNAHVQATELHRLRTTDFGALFGKNQLYLYGGTGLSGKSIQSDQLARICVLP